MQTNEMTPKDALRKLRQHMTLREIANIVGTTVTNLDSIQTGRTASPLWVLGNELIKLATKKTPSSEDVGQSPTKATKE